MGLFSGAETIYAILKEGTMGNIHVKLYEIRTSGSGGMLFKEKVYGRKHDRLRLITIAHLEPLAQAS